MHTYGGSGWEVHVRMQAATAGMRLKQIRWEWLGGTCEDAGSNSRHETETNKVGVVGRYM